LFAFIERIAVVAPPVFVTPRSVPLEATVNVTAPAVPSPMLLLFRLIVVETAPVFETPVKAEVLPVSEWPRTVFKVMLNTPGRELFTIPINEPGVEQLRTLLLFMLIVAAESREVMPWLRIISNVEEVLFVTVTVLTFTLLVNVVAVGDVPV
jgi:hypothetical protein